MKVRAFVETEVDVEVSPDDFISELSSLPDAERIPSMLSAVNTAYGILKRIPDESIAEMLDTQRETIAGALLREASRYKKNTSPTGVEETP